MLLQAERDDASSARRNRASRKRLVTVKLYDDAIFIKQVSEEHELAEHIDFELVRKLIEAIAHVHTFTVRCFLSRQVLRIKHASCYAVSSSSAVNTPLEPKLEAGWCLDWQDLLADDVQKL